MSDLESRVERLEQRVRTLEDELAIHRLINRYGLAVDTGDAARSGAVFAREAVYDVDVRLMEGRAAVEDMVRSEHHQKMVGHCAHQMGPLIVRPNGDRAVALGYSRVYLRDDGGIEVYRVSFNRWDLERRQGAWTIVHRRTRLLGHDEGKEIFAAGLAEV